MSFMVRARLKHDASSIAGVSTALADVYGSHQAVWSMFADRPDRKRDFVYRIDQDDGVRVMAVSQRTPQSSSLWDIEVKQFEPRLSKGDLLQFNLRANATRRSGGNGGRSDGRRHDVVMDAIHRARGKKEDFDRQQITQEAGAAWFAQQAERHGFGVEHCMILAHQVHDLQKKGSMKALRISGLDLEGMISVHNPEKVQRALHEGIGSAKGFGFGLLLVRRA